MNRFNVFVIYVFLTTISVTVAAQNLEEEWYRGKLYLANGEKIEGYLQYNLDKNYLVIKQGNRVKAYNAQQIESFEYLDHIQSRLRSFYSILHKDKRKKQHGFFELLKQGDLTLLTREYFLLTKRSFLRPFSSKSRTYGEDMIQKDEYFVLDQQQKLIPFHGTKKQLISLMQDDYEVIDNYIKSENLQLESRVDVLKLFYFYNNLKELQAQGEK